jgi:hypothetical protein
LAASYVELKREEEVRAEAASVLRIDPKFSGERFAKIRPHEKIARRVEFV